jgi:ribosomal protein S20
MPSTRAKEIECNTKLFSRSNAGKFKVEFNIQELLKADLKTEQEVIDKMVGKGLMTINEARKMRNLNPVEGGDIRVIQSGFIPADRMDDFVDSMMKNESTAEKWMQLQEK